MNDWKWVRISGRVAEKLLGKKIDKRQSFWTSSDGKPKGYYDETDLHLVFVQGVLFHSCSGCYESEDGHPVGEYPVHPKHGCYIGSGCSECGYHGIRRDTFLVPYMEVDD